MSVLNEIFCFFGYITWYYIAFAIIFYGIIYILEVQLGIDKKQFCILFISYIKR